MQQNVLLQRGVWTGSPTREHTVTNSLPNREDEAGPSESSATARKELQHRVETGPINNGATVTQQKSLPQYREVEAGPHSRGATANVLPNRGFEMGPSER